MMKTVILLISLLLLAMPLAQSTEQEARTARLKASKMQLLVDKAAWAELGNVARNALSKGLGKNANFEDITYAYEVCVHWYDWYVFNDDKAWDRKLFTLKQKFNSLKVDAGPNSQRAFMLVNFDDWGSKKLYEIGKDLIKSFPTDPVMRRLQAIMDSGQSFRLDFELKSFQYFSDEIKKYPSCIANYAMYASSATVLGNTYPGEKKKYFTIARDAYLKIMSLVPRTSGSYKLAESRVERLKRALSSLPG